MEKICSFLCFVTGTVFLVLAIVSFWGHIFTMGICYAAGLMVKEDETEDSYLHH